MGVGDGMAKTCKYYMWASRWLCHTQGGVSPPMGGSGRGVWGAIPMNFLKINPFFLQSGGILWWP